MATATGETAISIEPRHSRMYCVDLHAPLSGQPRGTKLQTVKSNADVPTYW